MVSVKPVVAHRAVVDWASWLTSPVLTVYVVVVRISLGAAPRIIPIAQRDAGVVHSPLVPDNLRLRIKSQMNSYSNKPEWKGALPACFQSQTAGVLADSVAFLCGRRCFPGGARHLVKVVANLVYHHATLLSGVLGHIRGFGANVRG